MEVHYSCVSLLREKQAMICGSRVLCLLAGFTEGVQDRAVGILCPLTKQRGFPLDCPPALGDLASAEELDGFLCHQLGSPAGMAPSPHFLFLFSANPGGSPGTSGLPWPIASAVTPLLPAEIGLPETC